MTETSTNASNSIQYSEFVWRRLEEPLRVLSYDLPWQMWLVLLGVVLGTALFYVVWMYIKDSIGVGPIWASLLGILRLSVYAILAVVFLLPANQSFVETRSESKVILLFDTSGSMGTSDELATIPTQKLTSRMDRVADFLLRDGKANFLPGLEKKNPITAYRFGSKLDEEYLHFANGRVWSREEKEKPARDDDGVIRQPEVKPLADDYWRAWLNPALKVPNGDGMSELEQKRLDKLRDHNVKMVVKEGITRGTNIADSTLAVINKELNNRVQGIVIFTDGRNTEGSPNGFTELASRAKAARIPIFVVAVGEDRLKVKIDIVDLRIPPQIQPEDKFRTVAEITGEGLAGQKLEVSLEITHTRTVKVKKKDKTGKDVEEEKEEPLGIELIEKEDPDNPKSIKERQKIPLGTKLTLKPKEDPTLDKEKTPRLEVEWQIDAAVLAEAAKIDLTSGEYKSKKWEIAETREDSELKYQVRVPVDKREALKIKHHLSEKLGMKVIKRPIRALLFAGAANRDYQFVRELLIREMDKKRIELAICLQPPPGSLKYREGVVQGVPKERMLTYFPDTFGKKKDLYDLSSYDVIICYDPDWNRLAPDQMASMKRWAEKGGGLVVIGGYINTVELIRPREEDPDRFKAILDLLPVVLDDRRDYTERKTDDPFALDFEGATPEMEFLKLDEELDESKFKEDWQAFFYGTGKEKTDKPQRGFFNFYPVQKAKTGSVIVARFTDPTTKLKDNSLHPYIVLSPEQLPRVIWIGSAETWRLREYREAYHERFWTKLVRYAASKSKGAFTKAIRIEMGKNFIQNRYVPVEAKIDGSDGSPFKWTSDGKAPEITLKMPPGVSDKEIKQPIKMTSRPGARDGWFSGQFQVKSPGEYELTIKVPMQPGQDSDTIDTQKFTVKEANPEQDNTRPDFDRMYRLASEADEVLLRMSEADRAELKRKLQRPKAEVVPGVDAPDKTDISEDKARLYFDLKNAGLIPGCMVQDVQKQTSRGPHQDLWDGGVTLKEYPAPEDPAKPQQKPIQISYVLMIVVGLLSMEWLIRKLLRLA